MSNEHWGWVRIGNILNIKETKKVEENVFIVVYSIMQKILNDNYVE